MNLCNACPVEGLEITEEQLVAGWERLVLDPRTREKLASNEFAAFDSQDARQSTDPSIHKTVTGRAIAQCITRNCFSHECPLSAVYRYATVDDAMLFAGKK